jgi:(hydroxyamino)benzene mutase
MTTLTKGNVLGHRLVQLGMLLFLIGLITGFGIPAFANPRMGLSSHLEAIMNGFFLVLLGMVWPRLMLSSKTLVVLFWVAIYSTFANWGATLLAAVWGAGEPMMPIAAGGFEGTSLQEFVISFLLITLSLGIVATAAMAVWGLRVGAARVEREIA